MQIPEAGSGWIYGDEYEAPELLSIWNDGDPDSPPAAIVRFRWGDAPAGFLAGLPEFDGW